MAQRYLSSHPGQERDAQNDISALQRFLRIFTVI